MKEFFDKIFNRLFLVAIALLVQILWILAIVYGLSVYYSYINVALTVIGLILVVRIVNKWNNPSVMLAWTAVILAAPIFGTTIYFMFGRSGLIKPRRIKYQRAQKKYSAKISQDEEVYKKIKDIDESVAAQSKYITDYSGYPIYDNTTTKYYAAGEEMYFDLLEDLKKAEHYIYMEFFIIGQGVMWENVLGILEEKVKEGVDVKIIYDDVGSINVLPHRYYKELQAKGIECAAFNPFRPFASIVMNNRDHRKIVTIDGYTAYTGGINLADEYINAIDRFGHWKDAGIRIQGDAVYNFTIMFAEMWSYITEVDNHTPEYYRSDKFVKEKLQTKGFVQPYTDSPLDQEYVGENVYINILLRAKRYVYIFTPYLVIDNETMTSLCLAAKSGVDVRIITPAIPDKKLVFLMTQSYYERLLSAGVKIYQYSPGFVHSKCFVCDDEIATVGSINLDYRSLYMHFECGVWMYNTDAVFDVKEDFLNAVEYSEEITMDFCKKRNKAVIILQSLLRLFTPLF